MYDLLTTLCIPASPIKETYKNICEKLHKHYHPKTNYAINQAEFRKRTQRRDESIDQYILELKKISKNCNFKNLDDELKERLLNGVFCEAVRFECLKQAEESLEKMIRIAKTAETAYNLAYNKEKEQDSAQMFKFQEKKTYKNRNFSKQQTMHSHENLPPRVLWYFVNVRPTSVRLSL